MAQLLERQQHPRRREDGQGKLNQEEPLTLHTFLAAEVETADFADYTD